jgi:hypothetical protein
VVPPRSTSHNVTQRAQYARRALGGQSLMCKSQPLRAEGTRNPTFISPMGGFYRRLGAHTPEPARTIWGRHRPQAKAVLRRRV